MMRRAKKKTRKQGHGIKSFRGSPKARVRPLLFDSNPYAQMLLDSGMRVLDCNPQSIRFFGYPSAQALQDHVITDIRKGIPERQSTGRQSIPMSHRFELAMEYGRHEFDTELYWRGKKMLLTFILTRVVLGGSFGMAVSINERREAEQRMQLMLDATPLACGFVDPDTLRLFDCNQQAVRLYGFADKEELILRQADILPPKQPDGTESAVWWHEKLRRASQSGQETFTCTHQTIAGEQVPVEMTIACLNWRDSNMYAIYARDLRVLKAAESELRLHAGMLQAVNTVATSLMGSAPEEFETAVMDALRVVGQAVDVHRSSIWRNVEQDGELYCSQLYEWFEETEPRRNKDFSRFVRFADIPYWRDRIMAGRSVNGPVKLLPAKEQAILEPQGVRSILVVPLQMHGKAWGFMGFDDCRKERIFNPVKEKVLRSAGILILSSILRNDMTRQLISAGAELRAHDKLLRAVNEVARYLLEADQDDFMDTLYKSLITLGICAGVDRLSIWRNGWDEQDHPGGRRLAVWDAQKPETISREEAFVDYRQYLPHWLYGPEDIYTTVEQIDPEIREAFLPPGCHTLLLMPLHVHGDFWGFIAFSDRRAELTFSEVEMSILRSGGLLIASALVRHEVNLSLIEARESALASVRSKSAFLSRMSHEIRTPMNAIIGMTTLAQKSEDIERIRYYLNMVDASSRQLLGIINDVLDMSKIDANKLEIVKKEFDFENLIRHVLNVMQVKLEEKKQEFRLDFPRVFSRYLISDELRLSQVLLNLLGNAVKFTPDGGTITLQVTETPLDEDNSQLRLQVIDNGIGIAPDQLSAVFQAFEQGDGSIIRQYGGTGLGLAICKRIINLMGGDIWAESEPGQGSRFIVEMNVAWGSPRKDVTMRTNLRILAVDDDPHDLAYFQSILESLSLACDIAKDGEEALTMLSRRIEAGQAYDVIFLDWYMPAMDGGQTAQEIKRIMGDSAVVVMVSAADWSEIGPEATSAGVRHFLPKPVFSADVYNTLLHLSQGQPAEEEQETAQGENGVDWSGHCVLLAEDIEINREIVSGILEDTGLLLEYAVNGREAVSKFSAAPDRYELILMDVQMPMLDGMSATRQIRASGLPGADTIPIIAMTANAFKEDEQLCLEAGMNGHIAKPIDVAEIFRVLKGILEPGPVS